MAALDRFIDAGVSPGGVGTEADPFASWSEFETESAQDLTDAGGDTMEAKFRGTDADTTGNVSQNGWTVNATSFVTYSGNNTSFGKLNTSAYRMEFTAPSTYDHCVRFQEDFTVINDMQFVSTNTTHNSFKSYLLNAGFIKVNRCIAKGINSGGWSRGFDSVNVNGAIIQSCLAYDFTVVDIDEAGIRFTNNSTIKGIGDNCTVHNCSSGIASTYQDSDIRNILAQDCADSYLGTFNSADSCAGDSGGGPIPGTNTQTGDVTFVDEAGDDFQPASTDTVAKDNGAALSPAFGDLKGDTFTTPFPIGCLNAAVADVLQAQVMM